ncbi:MAG: heavy metal translocating P-type ATPase [Caldilineaceae bacterium]
MTTQPLNQPTTIQPTRERTRPPLWRENPELVLAAITLIALIIGWLGGSVTGALPPLVVYGLAVIAFAAGGYSGLMGAIEEAREGRLDIDFLMITAALGAALIGQWEEGALLLFLFTLSGALEEFAMDRTRNAIEALADLRPDVARVRRDGLEVEVPVGELQVGNIVLVRPGERLPVDGVVVKGASSIDQSPITGESVPVHKQVDSVVYAGTINGGGALEVEMSKPADESTLNKIIKLVAEAQEDATPTQQFIDRFSTPYTYVVIGATLLAIVLPVLFGNEPFDITLYRAMTLLVVASPCALIISTPASVLSAIAAGARNGALFKGGAYLEKMAEIRVFAFDKTGTLTPGRPVVTNLHALSGHTADDLVRLAASAETLSEHHIARALMDEAAERGLELDEPMEFSAIAGHGLQAKFDRGTHMETVYIGNDKLFMNEEMEFSRAISMIGDALQRQGKTVMLVVRRSTVEDTVGSERDWEPVGFIGVADAIRPEAPETVRRLHAVGIERVMFTGDKPRRGRADRQGSGDRRGLQRAAARAESGHCARFGAAGTDGHGGRRRQRRAGLGHCVRRRGHGRGRHRRGPGDRRRGPHVQRPVQIAVHRGAGPPRRPHRAPERGLFGGRDHHVGAADHRGAVLHQRLCDAVAAGRSRPRGQHAHRRRQRAAAAGHARRQGRRLKAVSSAGFLKTED